MKWRYWLIIAGLLGLIATIILVVFMWTPDEPGVTKANFDRIGAGMSRADVEALFDRQPDASSIHGGYKVRHTVDAWDGADGTAVIIFHEERAVVVEKERSWHERSLFGRVRRRLGL